MKSHNGDFNENLSSKSKFGYNRTKISVTLHEDLSTFIVTSDKIAIKSWLTAKCSATTRSNALLNFHGNVLNMDYAHAESNFTCVFPSGNQWAAVTLNNSCSDDPYVQMTVTHMSTMDVMVTVISTRLCFV